MIEITRSLAHHIKNVFRRAITASGRGRVHAPVLLHAGPAGLRVRIVSPAVAAEYYDSEYHDSQPREADAAQIPFELLQDCAANCEDAVQIEMMAGDQVLATWNDGQVPRRKRYAIQSGVACFPEWPEAFAENPLELADALHAAMQTVSLESSRYSLNCVQLRGAGAIVATDGVQLLLQSGFEFPWDEDLLVPARAVFSSTELAHGNRVQVGRSASWICFRLGCWSILFAIDKAGRFPTVETYLRDSAHATASIQIDAHDAEFLVKSMKQLRGGGATGAAYSPVTVDAHERICIRAETEVAPHPVELLLSNSTCTGQPVRINTDRKFLLRALDLGFRQLHVFAPDQPLVGADDRRKFLWAVLTPSEAIKPSDDAVRICSPFDRAATSTATNTNQVQQEITVANVEDTTVNSDQQPRAISSTEELIETAEQLKAALRDTLSKTSELIVGLKRHRKEAKLVRTTLDSLRQLQTVG